MENEPVKEKSGWLTELEAKSWSLEMTISGAATFAVSFLPGLIEQGLDYYLDNLAPANTKFAVFFPILSYSFFMAVAWTLISFFGAHLCVRALWVSAVGLHSAFPAGIRYDRLPNVSEQYKQLAKTQYGSLEDYIYRLDKRSNKMFALAFVLSLGFGGIGIAYLLIFLLLMLLRNVMSPELLSTTGLIAYGVFMTVIAVTVFASWWMKRHPGQERLGNILARFQLGFVRFSNPLFSNAQQYLTQTFLSNISRKSYYGSMMLITTLMSVFTIFIAIQKIGKSRGNMGVWDRSYYSQGSMQYRLDPTAYDALRPEAAAVPAVSIPADVVSEPYLPVFVKYPRYLDARLKVFCGAIDIPKDTSISTRERNRRVDSLYIQCMQRFLQVQLNDSIVPVSDWIFMEKQGTKGLITYLNTKGMPPGKNTLRIKMPAEQKPDSLEVFGQVYFWFTPE